MSELNVVYPFCCITGKYCSYNNGFIDGYMIGIASIILIISIFICLDTIIIICKGKSTVESDDEITEENIEKEKEDKSEDQKKDD